jgi:hypothetical protein
MAILGFIFGLAAAIFSVVGWGIGGTAIARAGRLEEDLEALKRRVQELERART